MIEKITWHYLARSILAYPEMPEDFPDRPFAVVEKIGGGEGNLICSSRLAVQSYGRTLSEAAALNERVKALMKKMIELDEVSKVSLDTDYNFTDPTAKRYRYQAVFDITHY